MPPESNPGAETLERWRANVLRLTAFQAGSLEIDKLDWWERVTGETPEEQVHRPRTPEIKESGEFAGGKLTLHAQPSRLDWLLVPSAAMGQPGPIMSIGSLPVRLDSFLPAMKAALELAPTLRRIAFGAVLFWPVGDRTQGYEELNALLPDVQVDASTSQELAFQINRPRETRTGIHGLRINRLSKWAVLRMASKPGGELPSDLWPSSAKEGFAIVLDLDVNTVPEFAEAFQTADLWPLFSELVDFGKELAQEGDIP